MGARGKSKTGAVMRYPLTFYASGRPLKDWQAGAAFGPFIFIRAGYEADEGLYQHELAHVKQAGAFVLAGAVAGLAALGQFPEYGVLPALWGALAGLIACGLAYKFVRRWRLFAEAQAYATQMRYPDQNGNFMSADLGAYRLALQQYGLGISVEEAKQHLDKQ